MNVVKDKKMLCQTSLADFSVESVNDVPFYRRWSEFGKLFASRLKGIDFEKHFAQPHENLSKKTIEWFFAPGNESPVRLSELKNSNPEEYSLYAGQRREIVSKIKSALASCNENEAKYLKAAMVNLEADYVDSVTYGYDGHVLFGVWGMRTKVGRQIDSVITEGVQDHRAFRVNYAMEGEGKITPFSSINRRYGHILTGDKDIPNVIPAKGWSFVEWSPEAPHGKVVKEEITYVAICRQDSMPSEEEEKSVDEGLGILDTPPEEAPQDAPQEPKEELPKDEEEKKKYTVRFRTDGHGVLNGQTEYEKYEGEKVLSKEVPEPVADDGYEFIGWNKEPRNHEVHEDVEFTARYRKISVWAWRGSFWRALLHWLLLLLLLLLLFLLIWCVFFDKCNLALCKEPCNCELIDSIDTASITPDEPVITHKDPANPPERHDCSTATQSGGDEGFMGYYDMHTSPGTFILTFNTYSAPDRITVYDGEGNKGRILYDYSGGSGGIITQRIKFHEPVVTVQVTGLESGTVWDFEVGCPE